MKGKKQKKHLTDAWMLVVIFILAVLVFNRGTNKENRNMTADMGSAMRPWVTFSYNGYALNPLPVYAKKWILHPCGILLRLLQQDVLR